MLNATKITLHPRPKNSNIAPSYYSPHPVIEHNYNLTINEPDLCSQNDKIFLLILYRTIYSHVKWREIIRELVNHQNSVPHQKGLIVKHVFIFGNSGDPHSESLIQNESKYYRDIIQEDFRESYFNLTIKVVTAWKWAVNYCPNAEYVMILNDELLVDLDKIIDFLLLDYSIGQLDNRFSICYPRINKVPLFMAQPRYRAMPRNSVYHGKKFPPYCHGWGYAAHINVINKLYKASFTTPAFMPTDAWIGVLSEKLRLGIPDHIDRYVLDNVERYFDDRLYPTHLGMIAVTDFRLNKGHELKVMKSFLKSMRRHWQVKAKVYLDVYSDKYYGEYNYYHYYSSYVLICIVIFFCVVVVCKNSTTRRLKC